MSDDAPQGRQAEIVDAICAEAISVIAAEGEAARREGQIDSLAGLLEWVRRSRVATTSILRRAILAEVRDEIESRLEELRND